MDGGRADRLKDRQTDRPTDLTVRERVYGKKKKDELKRCVPVWHNIIIVHGESMSRRGEMGFLKDEFDNIFIRAAWLLAGVALALWGDMVY